ncbi:FKBP-type peptidyl-prolyl cis-trans isomerase [Hydromonas duriensis]|uniref:peptidylprolyl isomerase n=1 Tax=Hydromonas duriensis TaxID=1527608 RepID=A0A4R6Y9A7_9BURK|nr:peptidylprolyl isomerase [Hydromonas duriensis]TDR32032.1 FKBP-type peptidyl-prolyl cis-trans isomerase SlpA [Hydromonas duriensis]
MSTSENQSTLTVSASSHVTLHYRITVLDEILSDFLSTFEGNPATVAIGQAQLAPFMEERLLGLAEGTHEVFDLTAAQAFGDYNPDLRQEVGRGLLLEGNPQVDEFVQGDFVEFSMPNGYRMTGVFQDWNQDKSGAWIDFNHPLAGKALRLELKVIGVL